MTKQEKDRYENPNELRKVLVSLKGRKFRLDCGHSYHVWAQPWKRHHHLQRQEDHYHLLAVRVLINAT